MTERCCSSTRCAKECPESVARRSSPGVAFAPSTRSSFQGCSMNGLTIPPSMPPFELLIALSNEAVPPAWKHYKYGPRLMPQRPETWHCESCPLGEFTLREE